MRFYLDEDLPPRLSETLRRRGIHAVSAHELGSTQLTDRVQLDRAVRQGRCLVSANVRDFIVIGRAAIATGTPHAGIVLFSGDEINACLLEDTSPTATV